MRYNRPTTLLLLLCITICACRKHSAPAPVTITGPACDIEHARVTNIGYTNGEDTSWTGYTYDQGGRVIYIGAIRCNYDHDTFSYDYTDQGYLAHVWRYYRPNGILDRVRSVEVNNTAPFDTVKTYDYSYVYDNLNQLTAAVVHRIQNGIPGIVTTDSTIYTWQDGNMVRSHNYHDNTDITYDYTPNTNGMYPTGEPLRQAHWLYTIGKPVLSKNLLQRRITNARDTTFYEHHFNSFGTLSYTKLTFHNVGSEPYYSTTVYKYECY